MRVGIYLFALLIALSGCREVVNMALFLYYQNALQETVCINKNIKSKKCKGKCFLAKKLKQNQSEKEKPLLPVQTKNGYEFFMPEDIWLCNLSGNCKTKQKYFYLGAQSGQFVADLLRPPDVCI